MPIYVYETIPSESEGKPIYFEVLQNFSDEPLTKHPDTGEPVRRVLLGNFGVLSTSKPSGSGQKTSCCSPRSGCCSGRR